MSITYAGVSWVCATSRCDRTISNLGQSYCTQCQGKRAASARRRAANRKARAAGYNDAEHQADQEAAMAWATGRSPTGG